MIAPLPRRPSRREIVHYLSPGDPRRSPRRHDGRMMPLLISAIMLTVAPWSWPVAPPHAVVRPYIAPATTYGAGHRGVDLTAANGIVRAPADGTVHFAGTVVDRPVLSLRHAGGLISSFEPVVTTLSAGETVRRGQVIAVVQPGHCSSPCLHFGVRRDGVYINPLTLLGGAPRAVLLPTRASLPRLAPRPPPT